MNSKEWTTYYPPTAPFYNEQPSAVNGVSYKRYRVTVEEIEEDDEVIRHRLMALCADGTNHHHLVAWKVLERRYGFVVGGYKQPARLATADDRANWEKEDAAREESRQRVAAQEEAERIARNAKAKRSRSCSENTRVVPRCAGCSIPSDS
jgi:hypothetical protein